MRSPHLLPAAHLSRPALARWIVCGLAALALGGLYAATLQTHISGSFSETSPQNILYNEYIKDVAEIQVALNVWGTIHHTGYPLFAILGNLFTLPLRVLGVEPAAAASLYAVAWGMLLLGGFALLVWRLTGRVALAVISAALGTRKMMPIDSSKPAAFEAWPAGAGCSGASLRRKMNTSPRMIPQLPKA